MTTVSIRLDRDLVEKATLIGMALGRTTPKQIENWTRIVKIMEDNPDLPYQFVTQKLRKGQGN